MMATNAARQLTTPESIPSQVQELCSSISATNNSKSSLFHT
ncbi:hypothetical protein QY895_03700 [Latilactobacillus sakei]